MGYAQPYGLRCASRGDQSPQVPPCPPGELDRRATGVTPYTAYGLTLTKGESDYLESKPAGPKAGKVSVHPF